MSKPCGLCIESQLGKKLMKISVSGGTMFRCLIMENLCQKLRACFQLEHVSIFLKVEREHAI